MNKADYDSATRNALEQQQLQQESASENEASDTVTDQSSSLSYRAMTARKRKQKVQRATNNNTSAECTPSMSPSSSTTTQATQFSVQQSDANGLRMKISAIRAPPLLAAKPIVKRSNSKQKELETRRKQKSPKTSDKLATIISNNSTDDKMRIEQEVSSTQPHQTVGSGAAKQSTAIIKLSTASSGNELPLALMPQVPCLSDASVSGCSEVTVNAKRVTTQGERPDKKLKIKRKRGAHKGSMIQKVVKRARTLSFSSESEDDKPLRLMLHGAPYQQQEQRAPRLLLTAINSKCVGKAFATTTTASDHHIGLSSSDNELPDLVSAAIKRVESDTDDTADTMGFRRERTKAMPQYQSTLLQDFMEKTQMLGQITARPSGANTITTTTTIADTTATERLMIKQARGVKLPIQTASVDSPSIGGAVVLKKRRGRPKKVMASTTPSEETLAKGTSVTAAAINESGDSGVTSTTSLNSTAAPLTSRQRSRQQAAVGAKEATSNGLSEETTPSVAKPKIDIAYLDKRIYANERVLYPPPRNKRRQSTSNVPTATTTAAVIDKRSVRKLNGEESSLQQLDPVWRKIDIHKKFRRPSVCGYKSDGGGGNTTICSKVLAAKSGYVSDYGTFHARTPHHQYGGYKSDASAKSRYSNRSCVSRRSRAKSCGYRSDCKESSSKAAKLRRKRRCSFVRLRAAKFNEQLNDEHEILQLAGLSLGQSSEESSEFVCKPTLQNLPTTSVSKKYGEINRFVATGEYFGRGSSGVSYPTVNSVQQEQPLGRSSPDGYSVAEGKTASGSRKQLMLLGAPRELPEPSRKIKLRRSSGTSYCSSHYSSTSRVKRRRRRKITVDSKLLTEIDIVTSTFAIQCRIHGGAPGNSERGGVKHSATSAASGKSGTRDKRALKKRKMSESLDFALLSAAAASGYLAPGTGTTKRRHKKANSSSPDDHKLPLKKRHYLLTPGEKSSEAVAAAAAVAAKLYANKAEAWAAAAALAKSTAASKAQQQFSSRAAAAVAASKECLTPKKRHLMHDVANGLLQSSSGSSSSPLRIAVDGGSPAARIKLLDISPASQPTTETHSKKRLRLEGLVSKIVGHSEDVTIASATTTVTKNKGGSVTPHVDSETSSCPPPGVFEPSVALEIQIPPITKLSEAAAAIITKSEVASPLLSDLQTHYAAGAIGTVGALKLEGSSGRVVEVLLTKTGGASLLLRRKRKKINRTGFPTVRRKKRKINDQLLLDVTPDITEQVQKAAEAAAGRKRISHGSVRVPQAGEASECFVVRAVTPSSSIMTSAPPRTPRLSVVALERLQGTPTSSATISTASNSNSSQALTMQSSPGRQRRKKQLLTAEPLSPALMSNPIVVPEGHKIGVETKTPRRRGRKPNRLLPVEQSGAFEVNPPTVPLTTSKLDKSLLNRKSMERIITAKTLETKVKLPAGIDPNTNFSCKIRLKRRNSLYPPPNTASGGSVSSTLTSIPAVNKYVPELKETKPPKMSKSSKESKMKTTVPVYKEQQEPPISAEQVDDDAAAKDVNCNYEEHEVLPWDEANMTYANLLDGPRHSLGDKSATLCATRKMARKTYLHAGLFSDYFKTSPPPMSATAAERKLIGRKTDAPSVEAAGGEECYMPLLPPPPYCEKYYRRRRSDFELPYDIWWAHKNLKLPTRMRVPSWNYRKIRTNVYADALRPHMAGFEHPTCNCQAASGCGDNCLNRMVYTECSPTSCNAREHCTNQKIQRHEVAPGVERFMTENKGWGVRTKLPIPKGTYILEYVGEVVTEREFKERMAAIYLNDTHHYCLHLDGGLVIDGHRMGSDGRFVNHSCEPNCEMQKWSVNGLSRMALFAKRPIVEGEELTYDYNFSLFNPSEGQPCRCNTPQCRGVIGGKSQRVKPLPVIPSDAATKDSRSGRQRKRKAHKNTQRLNSKERLVTRIQQLTEKERKLVRQHGIFLMRNFERIYKHKTLSLNIDVKAGSATTTPTPTPRSNSNAIGNRRPSTPSSVVSAQISVLCSQRHVMTRGLTLAAQDPGVEKMAKIAIILRDICIALELLRDESGNSVTAVNVDNYVDVASNNAAAAAAAAAGNKKKKALLPLAKAEPIDLKPLQSNIQQGYYATPLEFDQDMQKIFSEADKQHKADSAQLQKLQTLRQAYEELKQQQYTSLLQLVGEEAALEGFQVAVTHTTVQVTAAQPAVPEVEEPLKAAAIADQAPINAPIVGKVRNHHHSTNEDIISCICGLYKDEGLMIQCARCMVWQHAECTKADIKADSYHCERCEARIVDYEIPLEDYTDEGYRYYLTLMRDTLHVRQGDAVYVLRDIPIKDAAGNVVPQQKHTYETIGQIDYNECDIFRVERLWKNDTGKRFIFGHHFLRPHETFHEPSRRFYPNEVVRVPLYEVVPIELVIGRCWVLDRTTFCKGRPIECVDEEHCYICELRVDKSARFFSKAKVNYPTCTKSYAFRKFADKLKISKTYAPHEVDPAMLKTKKQKTDIEVCSTGSAAAAVTPTAVNATASTAMSLLPAAARKQTQSQQTVKQKRAHLENILKTMKLKLKNTQLVHEAPIDLSYLLTGRGARQRRTQTITTA